MKRGVLAIGFAIALVAQLHADVTIKGTGTARIMGKSIDTATTTYLKGMKMRVDSVTGGTTSTTIFDVENQKMYIFDSKKKEADVFDMAVWSAEIAKSVEASDIKSSIKPNGQTKQIGGNTANGYNLDISVPFVVGGPDGMKMTMVLTGPAWIVKGAPGTAEYAAFYRGAAEKDWIFSDPRAAKSSPAQAKSIAEMYEKFADLGGMPYESQMDIKTSGEGPVAGMMAKMGNISMTSVTESIDTGRLADDLFLPPAGYKLNQRK